MKTDSVKIYITINFNMSCKLVVNSCAITLLLIANITSLQINMNMFCSNISTLHEITLWFLQKIVFFLAERGRQCLYSCRSESPRKSSEDIPWQDARTAHSDAQRHDAPRGGGRKELTKYNSAHEHHCSITGN